VGRPEKLYRLSDLAGEGSICRLSCLAICEQKPNNENWTLRFWAASFLVQRGNCS
jgi:hypothetical protein